jgi:lysine-arginine-ornithine-binding protein
MKLKQISTLLGASVLALGMFNAQAADMRIGVEGAYPPFSWKEADGSLKGFDIDIAHALCKEMGHTCTLVEQDWDGMIPALLAKKFDAIVASMSITDERKKRVDFTTKYYNTPARLVSKESAGLAGTAKGLAGKRIGVQRGTTHQCFAEKAFPDSEVVLYGTQEEVFRDLASGRIDVQLSDSLQALEGFLNKPEGQGFAFLGGDQNDLPCFGEGAGIALRKGSDDLRNAFDAAIKKIRADGTYKTLNDKYFKVDVWGS